MSAMVYGSRWQPKERYSRHTHTVEDDFDNRSTCSGTEASEDERPSRTSSANVSVIGNTGLGKEEGQKWGRQLLGLLKTGDPSAQGEPPPPPPPPPPLPPPKTKLKSAASLFIPKAVQSLPQPWEAQAQHQGGAYAAGGQCQPPSFDKEMFCWEYMHRGYCPRQSTCRWLHPPADSFSEYPSGCTSTPLSTPTAAFVPQSTFVQAPYVVQPALPQACPQVNFGPQVKLIPLGASCNFPAATFQNQIAPSSCATNFQSQCQIVPQILDCRNQEPHSSATSVAERPLSLPLVDINSQPRRHNGGLTELHDPDDETPWPDYLKDSRLQSLTPHISSSEALASEVVAAKTPTQKVSWADIQEDSDLDEPYLPQWQSRHEDCND